MINPTVASRIHSIIPRVAIGLGVVGVIGIGVAYRSYTRTYAVPRNGDIFSVVEGKWAWTTSDSACTTEWHRISFTPDRNAMTIASSKPYEGADGKLDSIAVYDIQRHTQTWIRGAIRGETRLTAAGQPVVWDLVLRTPDTYSWHRTDWAEGGYTPDIERCSS